jgi:hypothetical protein
MSVVWKIDEIPATPKEEPENVNEVHEDPELGPDHPELLKQHQAYLEDARKAF